MRQRRLLRFHGLKRGRIRQTWNKYNLYNLCHMKWFRPWSKTFFQQKWEAKSMTRAYHGEHIKEYQWERMFSRRIPAAVNMDPRYMARYDGSEQAAGRGSGRQVEPGSRMMGPKNMGNRNAPTPYMQMVFAPMERRLDIAIFRAMFASSARQARQFVLHGAVTVNGKKMRHPSYLLNPGDLFQVDVDRVLMATGQPKRPVIEHKRSSGSAADAEPAEGEEAAAAEDAEGAAPEATEGAADADAAKAAKEKHKAALLDLKRRAKRFMATKSQALRAKQKQAIRKAIVDIKKAMDSVGRSAGASTAAEMDEVEADLATLVDGLTLSPAELRARTDQYRKEEHEQGGRAAVKENPALLTAKQRILLNHLVKTEAENPYDPSKPYATPWRLREWITPFAFIPRYLEVNHRICAAVYLRHPVARPGLSEVPSPFSPVLSQLAFNWYLRRR